MRVVVLIALSLIVLTVPAGAFLEDYEVGALEESLPDEAGEIYGELSVDDALKPEGALKKLFKKASDAGLKALREAASGAVQIVAVVLLCAIAECFTGGSPAGKYVPLAGVLSISVISLKLGPFIEAGVETMGKLSDFSRILLPTLAMTAAASGCVTSAPARYAATVLFMELLLTVATKAVIPLICACAALAIANSAFGSEALETAAKLVKWATVAILTALVSAFTLYLTVTGILTDSSDAVTAKLAKSALSTVLPVVGGIISDAGSSVASGAAVARNAIGIFGLLAILAVCVTPIVGIGANYLLYKASAAASSAISGGRLSSLIDALADVFGLVLATVGSGAVILFVSIVSSIKVVSPL